MIELKYMIEKIKHMIECHEWHATMGTTIQPSCPVRSHDHDNDNQPSAPILKEENRSGVIRDTP